MNTIAPRRGATIKQEAIIRADEAEKENPLRRYTWFLDTKGDDRSNMLVAGALAETKYENEAQLVLCDDGKKRSLWRCPDHEFVASFKRTADNNRYPYDIYVREGENSPVRPWKFETPRGQCARHGKRGNRQHSLE